TAAPTVISDSASRPASRSWRTPRLRLPSNRMTPTDSDTTGKRRSPNRSSGSRTPSTGPTSSPATSSTMITGIRSRSASHWAATPPPAMPASASRGSPVTARTLSAGRARAAPGRPARAAGQPGSLGSGSGSSPSSSRSTAPTPGAWGSRSCASSGASSSRRSGSSGLDAMRWLLGRRALPGFPGRASAKRGSADGGGRRHDRRVVAGPGGGDLVAVGTGPGDERLDGAEQAAAERGELVVDPGRDDGVHGAGDEPVALQPAERAGEHPLADAVDRPPQLGEPAGAAAEQLDHQQRPLVGQAVEQVAQRAGRSLLDGREVGDRGVPGCPRC